MKFNNLYVVLLAAGSILALNACSNSASTKASETLVVDVGAEPPSLDPIKAEDVNSARIIYDLFAGLVDFDQQNNILPGMASKWEITPDGKTYTFHLRPGLKFSDGSPISAHDFVYSWQRLVNPKLASSYNFLLAGVVNAPEIIAGKLPITQLGVAASDDLTFVVKLTTPDSSFLNKITMTNLDVIPQQVIAKYGDDWTNPKHIVTSGAYMLKEHIVNGHILVTKNPNYYAAAQVSIPAVKFLPYVDLNAAVAAYKTDELDITYQELPVDQLQKFNTELGPQFHRVLQEAIGYYEFNMQDPELGRNLKLRQALSMAVDREALTRDVLQDGKTPLYSTVTPTVSNGRYAGLTYPWASMARDERLRAAKKLYGEAGYGPHNPYKVSISYNTNDMYKKISLALAAMWQENLGVKVTIQNQDWKTFLQTRHKGAYQIARGGWFADYNSVTTYTPLFQCHSPQNDNHWCDPLYDKLIDAGDAALDIKQQHQAYYQALQRVQDAYIIIPLFQFSFIRLVKPRVLDYDVDHNYLDHVQSKWLRLTKTPKP